MIKLRVINNGINFWDLMHQKVHIMYTYIICLAKIVYAGFTYKETVGDCGENGNSMAIFSPDLNLAY